MKIGALFASLVLFLPSCLLASIKLTTPHPAPGVSGVYYHKEDKIVHVHYGSDYVPGHTKHLMDHHEQCPDNVQPFNVGQKRDTEKRKASLGKIPLQPGMAQDEKPPNSINHDGKCVTVQPLPQNESSKHVL